jgi:DNA-binding LacI/PurR family transcriptional regulator
VAASDNLLVLAPWTAGFYFGEIISGITREAAVTGHHVIVAQTLDAGQQTDLHVDAPDFSTRVAWDHVVGAVAVATQGPYLHALRRAGKAVALASNDIAGTPRSTTPSSRRASIRGPRTTTPRRTTSRTAGRRARRRSSGRASGRRPSWSPPT